MFSPTANNDVFLAVQDLNSLGVDDTRSPRAQANHPAIVSLVAFGLVSDKHRIGGAFDG